MRDISEPMLPVRKKKLTWRKKNVSETDLKTKSKRKMAMKMI